MIVATGGEVITALKRAGFVIVGQRGSHVKLAHPDGRVVIVPVHNRDLRRGTMSSILKQAGLTQEELNDLL